jgi:hypothetical protein
LLFRDYSSHQQIISVLVAPRLRALTQSGVQFDSAQRTVRQSSVAVVVPCEAVQSQLLHPLTPRVQLIAVRGDCVCCVCVRAAFDVGSGPLSPTRTGATAKASKKRRSKTGADVSVTGTSPTPAVQPAVASPYSESTSLQL